MINPQQGSIFLAQLDPIQGREQGGFRPVLILQNNRLNHILNTFIVAPITTNLKFKGLFTTVFLEKHTGALTKDSVALLYQIRTLDKSRLKKFVGKITMEQFAQIRQQMMFVF